MSEILFQTIWRGDPRSKKNSQQIFRTHSGRPFISPSKAYKDYAKQCIAQTPRDALRGISEPVSVCCTYYMRTRRKVDLVNLLESTLDILVTAGVLTDDNSQIAVHHDGSRVRYDKENPRVEIVITRLNEQVNI